MTAYYNEIDPYAAQWLRNLIDGGHIARGDVDERSIVDVRAADLAGYTQCHFFAGIAGWSLALRLAGWPDDRPVWTGSCPCQPFSAAGAGKAGDDERHLWPAWFPLIAERRPPIVFGEQVEAAIGWGWLDLVFADLESEGYACGAAVLPACGVGAPHIRQRTWFVAHADGGDAGAEGLQRGGEHGQRAQDGRAGVLADSVRAPVGWRAGAVLGAQASLGRARINDGRGADGLGDGGQARDLADASGGGFGEFGGAAQPRRGGHADGSGELVELGDATAQGLSLRTGEAVHGGRTRRLIERPSNAGFWSAIDWLHCTDGKARPVEPGSFPLAHGIPQRPSKLRAYGNAIVPQTAAEFIRACC